jgi:hypothetical protein
VFGYILEDAHLKDQERGGRITLEGIVRKRYLKETTCPMAGCFNDCI